MPDPAPLRTGWTTGACATAAVKAALTALVTGGFPDRVSITLPRGETPDFPLAAVGRGPDWALAGIEKDAGDDPDVTHQALVLATVRRGEAGKGVRFFAGEGVGTVTLPGLPIPPGEPAINPVPRDMMRGVVYEICAARGVAPDFDLEISVPGGAALAQKTWNPRLGIEGGLSILGTTGVVRPFSCAAWIASIHRGVDVARAAGLQHVCGATGATSERTAQALYRLPDAAMLDMGDFAGGLLKYLRVHPVPRVTISGGFGKLTKLAQGALDLHSGRSQVDFAQLAATAEALGGHPDQVAKVKGANTAKQALELASGLGPAIADKARAVALSVLRDAPIELDILVIDREGGIIARSGP